MQKKFFIILVSLVLAFGIFNPPLHKDLPLAFANDDEEDREEDEEGEDDKEDRRTNSQITNEKPRTETITTTVQKSVTTVIYDRDGDGIFDPDDPHPDIPEFIIVKDENQNGVVDTFEQEK